MNKTLTFSLDNIETLISTEKDEYEQAKKSRFAEVKIRLFGTGENAHTEPVDFETLKRSADSAYNIPLIAELNPFRDNKDFGGHGVLTGKQFSFGFIKESKDNPIVFEKDENTGKIFLTLHALIWKKYFHNIVEILSDRGNQVEVSVELEEIQGKFSPNGKLILHQFVLEAVTFLGEVTSAACKGAMAQLCFSEDNELKFAEDKRQYLQENFGIVNIQISNDESNIIEGSWSNPRQKLLSPILKAKNKKDLLNEAYLFHNNIDKDNITLSEVFYPHHIIKNGKLVLHKQGVQSAFALLSQNGELTDGIKSHLFRHYKTLGLRTTNFEEFDLTEQQFNQYFAQEFGKEETMLKDKTKTEEKEEKMEDFQKEEKKIEEAKVCEAEKGIKDEKREEEEGKPEEGKPEEGKKEEMSNGTSQIEGNTSESTVEDKKEEITFEDLQKENQELKATIEAMSDYKELKQFHEDTIRKQAEMAEMAEMAKVLDSLKEKGFSMAENTKQDLINKKKDFSNMDAWSNYVKAYVFDNYSITEEDGVVKMDIVKNKEKSDKQSTDIWTRIENK